MQTGGVETGAAEPGGVGAGGCGPAGEPGRGLVDAHVHVFPPEMIADRAAYLDRDARFGALHADPKAPLATWQQVLEHMDGHAVDVSVLVGFGFADQGLCRAVNDHIVEAVRAHPGRFAGLACVAPDAPGAVSELERCLDAGLRGCGELALEGVGAGDGSVLHAGRGLPAVAGCLRERKAVLLVHASEPVGHMYPGKGSFTPEACYALAAAFPGLSIVFAHMGGGLFVYETMPEVRRVLADTYYDTAAVPYLYGPEVYAAVIATAGPEKVLFGSDYPLLSPARYLAGLNRLAPPVRRAICAGNARRVLAL